MANEQNLKHFQKGYDERRNMDGAPPKIYNVLKKLGYGNADIIACFKEMMWYSVSELETISKDKGEMAIRGIMAGGLVSDWRKGNLNNTREFLLRLMGQPTQTIDQNINNTNPVFIVKDKATKDILENLDEL